MPALPVGQTGNNKGIKIVNRLIGLYQTTVGKKIIVAVTGIVMLGFLVGHVAGNLKVFLPPVEGIPDIDVYAEYLRTIGDPLLPHGFVIWAARIVLLISLVLHVACVIQLSRGNLTARETDYQRRTYARATPPARWMMFTGLFLLGFIIMHLAHFTVGAIEPSRFEQGQVYRNLQDAFGRFPWFAIYVASMAVIALHLYHGAWSLFQTLGLDNPDRNRGLRRLSAVIAIGLAIAFASIPFAFFSGVLKPVSAGIQAETAAADSAGLSNASFAEERP